MNKLTEALMKHRVSRIIQKEQKKVVLRESKEGYTEVMLYQNKGGHDRLLLFFELSPVHLDSIQKIVNTVINLNNYIELAVIRKFLIKNPENRLFYTASSSPELNLSICQKEDENSDDYPLYTGIDIAIRKDGLTTIRLDAEELYYMRGEGFRIEIDEDVSDGDIKNLIKAYKILREVNNEINKRTQR